MLWNNPIIASDATVRRAENITKYYVQDVAIKYRSRPTAYLLPADTKGISKVLELLEKHGIAYYELAEGTSLTLKRYSGNADVAELGAAKEFTFKKGAYIIPVDGYKAYLIASLFEPDNGDSSENPITLVKAGLLQASSIYRSEESFIAAKLGLEGTYIKLDLPEGKTVASASVDGIAYSNVESDGKCAYAVASEAESYVVTLSFTDGTSKSYNLGK